MRKDFPAAIYPGPLSQYSITRDEMPSVSSRWN
jgi:hypothetical protein